MSRPSRNGQQPRGAQLLWMFVIVLFASPAFAQGGGGPGGGGPGGGGPGGGPPPPQPLGPPPVPAENPITDEKAILGKLLFWDEQLSSDDTVACGSCHSARAGGSDLRSDAAESQHPGFDGVFGNEDDVQASLGIEDQDCDGEASDNALFGFFRQVTGRKTSSHIMAAYSPTLFWDGRATGEFADPVSGDVLIATGGALESQAIGPILSSVEMACDSRTWDDVTAKLETVVPMALALELTSDMEDILLDFEDYPALFENAFGDDEITPVRIAYAIATYERTLIPDESKFDDVARGDATFTPAEAAGRAAFGPECAVCHGGTTFTNNSFRNIGVRPNEEDLGRADVTGLIGDEGRFRVPSLRNVELRAPYFHNGGQATLADVLVFYDDGGDFDPPNLDPAMDGINLTAGERTNIELFLETLTDPRVADALAPFDEPVLRNYFMRGDANRDGEFSLEDAIATLDYLFGDGETPDCPDALDVNDSGTLDISDAIVTLIELFIEDNGLPAPGTDSFGPDPTEDDLGCGEVLSNS